MVRIGLSVYLMLATLAGPSLCCCRLSHLSAPFATWIRNTHANAAASNRSCCQHHGPAKDSQPSKSPDGSSCPCQGRCSETPALTLLEAEGTAKLHRDLNAQVVVDCDFLPTLAMSSAALTLFSSALSSPVLTGRDILSTLHTLRC